MITGGGLGIVLALVGALAAVALIMLVLMRRRDGADWAGPRREPQPPSTAVPSPGEAAGPPSTSAPPVEVEQASGDGHTAQPDETPYGETGTDYPPSPPPAPTPSAAEAAELGTDVPPTPEPTPEPPTAPPAQPEPPRTLDDSQQFRPQHRPDGTTSG